MNVKVSTPYSLDQVKSYNANPSHIRQQIQTSRGAEFRDGQVYWSVKYYELNNVPAFGLDQAVKNNKLTQDGTYNRASNSADLNGDGISGVVIEVVNQRGK